MQKITPFLWFDGKAEEAMNFYISIFKNSKIVSVSRYGEGGPGPKGTVTTEDNPAQTTRARSGLEQLSSLPEVKRVRWIESQWTARKREQTGIFPAGRVRPSAAPRPSKAWTGHPAEKDSESPIRAQQHARGR